MLLCPTTRTHLLKLLPKEAEVAEVGVATGDFSALILEHAQPRRLHLIDAWAHLEREDYDADPNNEDAAQQEARYQHVRNRFAAEIASGQVQMHRALSTDAAHAFADGQLDWIFLDANHSREGVTEDLAAFAPKIKPDGYLLGHDYANHPMALRMNFGVIEAVDAFVVDQDWAFVALTNEEYPSYVLTRSDRQKPIRELMAKLILTIDGIIDVPDFPTVRKFQQAAVYIAGYSRLVVKI